MRYIDTHLSVTYFLGLTRGPPSLSISEFIDDTFRGGSDERAVFVESIKPIKVSRSLLLLLSLRFD